MTSMEGVNGRTASEAPSSSSSDFYATDSPNKQPTCSIPAEPAMDTTAQATIQDAPMDDGAPDDREDDSSVDMDLSDDSRSPSPAPQPNVKTHALPSVEPNSTRQTPKRKLSDEDTGANGIAQDSAEGAKRPKLSADSSAEATQGAITALDLPVQLWQQIFLQLSPANLARCLRVCRKLKSHLLGTKATSPTNKAEAKDFSKVRVFDSEAIWAHARKLLHPTLPRPLARLTELQMLQLVGNTLCQFCGRPPVPLHPTSPFNCGPGADGVRVIWPFGIRSCGRCLVDNSLKDIDVLTSKAGSLRNGLPYCFLTPDLHFVPEIQRAAPLGIPSHLRAAKVYYKSDVQKIVEEQDDAVGLGTGAAEEWKKGLPARGKEAMADAARWETWEGQMPPGTDLSQLLREYDPSLSTSFGQAYHNGSVPNGMQPTMAMNGSYPMGQPTHYSYPTPFTQQSYPSQQAYTHHNNGPNAPHMPQPTYPLPSKPVKAAKTAQDVEEAFRARKADIERRCKELSPPLDPGALPHMPAFTATMQIPQPMTDEFWESFLKPRILAERDAAETAERMRQDHMLWLQAAVPHSVQDEPFSRPAKEVYDKDFEEAQEPLRRKLSEYADDFIFNHWTGGHLTKSNSPVFAVQVIEFVDRRYREDKLAGMLPAPEQPARGVKQGTPIPDPFLSLHNMKWVYDNKIRPKTDMHGRELFLCSGCTDAKQPKWLAFEGLIQHYGAKHTTAFSQGNVVVHWQTAEWPSELPFVRDPTYYMKHDKKSAHNKDHGRARRTPQTNTTPFHAPGSGNLLSDSPFFSGQNQPSFASGGYHQSVPEYSSYQYGQPQSHEASYTWPAQAAASNDQHAESASDRQLSLLTEEIATTWDSLDGVKEDVLLPCIRLHASLHKAVTQFEAQFGKLPNLDQITDILATKPELKPVKDAQALACGLCVSAQADASHPYYRRIQSVKLHNTSSLVSHFKLVHPAKANRHSIDWTTNMIELPEPEMVSRLLRAPGMYDDKLATIAAAFPTAFPHPLPKIGYVAEEQQENILAQKLLDRHFKKKDPVKKKKKSQHANGTPAREDSEPLPEAREDEYDPRRPMALPPSASTSLSSAAPFNFAPETLAALSQLNAVNMQGQASEMDNRAERSPSVGHAEPAKQPVPDISQILAQLTGGDQPLPTQPAQSQYSSTDSRQVATPPDTTSRGSSQPKQVYQDPYVQSHGVSPRRYGEERPTSSRYPPQHVYRASAEPIPRYDGQDSRAAQAYNARQFEQNRAQSFAEPAYSQQPRSPPRYNQVYEEAPHYAQQHQYAPAYRPEPPTQYIQVQGDRDRYAPTYQFAQSPPQPKYVDEHGRELRLVPVDSAPAPLQYVPHPMEQQYQQQYAQPAPPSVGAYAGSPPAQPYQPYAYDRQPVYYEAPAPSGPPPDQRYGYGGAARGSVPRR